MDYPKHLSIFLMLGGKAQTIRLSLRSLEIGLIARVVGKLRRRVMKREKLIAKSEGEYNQNKSEEKWFDGSLEQRARVRNNAKEPE
jgi:hypothetical protein